MRATEAFKVLLERGRLAGQLYALAGLFFTDRTYFDSVIEQYAESRRRVTTFFGCIMSETPVVEIVRHPNGIRLAQGQTLAEWYEQHYGEGWERLEPAEVFELDIVGGGWPHNLLAPWTPPIRARRSSDPEPVALN